MGLFETVDKSIREAMLSRDKVRLMALRGIKKEFLEAKTAEGSNGELSDEQAIKIMSKMTKQRKESAKIYTEQGRPELAENELAEVAVIEEFLPKAMSEDELNSAIAAIISSTGAKGPQDMGKVMGMASKQLAGRADGRAISTVVKAQLANL